VASGFLLRRGCAGLFRDPSWSGCILLVFSRGEEKNASTNCRMVKYAGKFSLQNDRWMVIQVFAWSRGVRVCIFTGRKSVIFCWPIILAPRAGRPNSSVERRNASVLESSFDLAGSLRSTEKPRRVHDSHAGDYGVVAVCWFQMRRQFSPEIDPLLKSKGVGRERHGGRKISVRGHNEGWGIRISGTSGDDGW